MSFDLTDLKPLAGAFAQAGLPILSKLIQAVAPPPFGFIASIILPHIADALGVDPEPAAIKAAVEKDPGAAKEKLALVEAEHENLLDFAKLQTELNMKEAESANLFVAGWRPGIGWSLGAMVTWQWTAAIWKGPMIESGIFNSMLTLLAGLMGLRSTEKWAGVATEAVKGLPKLLTRKKG
jgi:hypothetical protein